MRQQRQLTEKQKKKIDKLHERFVKEAKEGNVTPFPEMLFDALRPYHFGGMPLGIMLFMPEMCNGYAYDKSTLLTLAFEECTQIYCDIETLRIITEGDKGERKAGHAVVKAYGYIFDTSSGLMYTEEAFEAIEKPEIWHSHTKQECLDYHEIQEVLSGDFEKDKWSLIMTLPSIESVIKNAKHASTQINKKFLLAEIAKLKEAVNFDAMVAEQENDMLLMRTNPAALDEKFQIVRDEKGRELSRGGEPNPYYDTTPKALHFQRLKELKMTKTRAKTFLREVKKNPTANVYGE